MNNLAQWNEQDNVYGEVNSVRKCLLEGNTKLCIINEMVILRLEPLCRTEMYFLMVFYFRKIYKKHFTPCSVVPRNVRQQVWKRSRLGSVQIQICWKFQRLLKGQMCPCVLSLEAKNIKIYSQFAEMDIWFCLSNLKLQCYSPKKTSW